MSENQDYVLDDIDDVATGAPDVAQSIQSETQDLGQEIEQTIDEVAQNFELAGQTIQHSVEKVGSAIGTAGMAIAGVNNTNDTPLNSGGQSVEQMEASGVTLGAEGFMEREATAKIQKRDAQTKALLERFTSGVGNVLNIPLGNTTEKSSERER